ncbi:hypothetical protein SAMN04487752_1444 [Carnobacterium viridans]|uniref:Uncharacterized protein n=1 Tax=Carnobacterium viridans TaxID=174587 RepID=A0A1H0ZCM7_9LACT|nr:hypothetical protein SAMN04487752_1444 [Carnobacterium viridans]
MKVDDIEKWLKNYRELFLCIQLFLMLYFLVFSIDYTTTGLAGWILVSCIGLFIVAFSVKDYLVKKKMKYILLSIFVSSISSLVLIMGLWIITTLTSNMGN